jgi:hypothetical protein
MKRINMQSISISEVQRNLHKLDGFDIIEIVDRKRNQIKGYFLDSSYQSVVENIIGAKKQKKDKLLNIIGIINNSEEITKKSLREERLARYE